ncbi:hypothetical protein GGD83_000185 [Rhodoblastus sphagnicola]|nr:hypothetical protein [Rhodoblastus sphagnicola]
MQILSVGWTVHYLISWWGPSRDEAEKELRALFPDCIELSETFWGNATYAVLVDDESGRKAMSLVYLFGADVVGFDLVRVD